MHLLGWSWLQSHQEEKERPQHYWSACHCRVVRAAWWQRDHMCCHQQLRVIHRHVTLGPYNTAHLIMFLYALQEALLRREQRGDEQAEHPMYVVIWDNVNFHRGPRIREWFENNPRFINVCLPPYSPFLTVIPLKNFFLHGGGRSMTEILMHRKISFSQWMQHVTTLEWKRFKLGFGMLKDSFPVV